MRYPSKRTNLFTTAEMHTEFVVEVVVYVLILHGPHGTLTSGFQELTRVHHIASATFHVVDRVCTGMMRQHPGRMLVSMTRSAVRPAALGPKAKAVPRNTKPDATKLRPPHTLSKVGPLGCEQMMFCRWGQDGYAVTGCACRGRGCRTVHTAPVHEDDLLCAPSCSKHLLFAAHAAQCSR